MKTEWTKELCGTEKPEAFQKVSDDTYIQRINIQSYTKQDELTGEEKTNWSCISRFISNDIYETLEDQMTTPAQLELMKQFQLTDSNSVVIMSALAELYEDKSKDVIMMAIADLYEMILSIKNKGA